MKSIGSHPTSRHTQPRKGMSRAAVVVLAAITPIVGLLVVAPPVSAIRAPEAAKHVEHKSYVCKYVGTPGVDERLQTGKNPIWVDNHALTGKNNSVVKVGDTFSDKHFTSVVIVANTPKLTPEPSISACPTPVGPTKVTAVAPTATAPTCAADGALVVPADTAAIAYTSKPKGTGPGTYDVTAKAAKGYVLVGTSAWTITVLPMLTGEVCTAPVKVTPVAPTITAPTCLADGTLVVPADTAAVAYASTPSGTGPGTYTVTATAKTGYVIDGTSTWGLTVAPKLTGDQCATTVLAVPMNPTVVASTECEVQGSYTIPETTGVTYLLAGKAVKAGTYDGPASGTVTAKAETGYTLSNAAWSFALALPAADICEVDAPTTTPTDTTKGLPKTGAPVAGIATAGALALLLGFALLAAGTRRLPETLS